MLKTAKILLTGARSFFTLDVARRFYEQGYKVYAAETSHFHICRFSKAISKYFIIPSSRFQPAKFLEALVKITKKENIDFLIPAFEEIFCLSKGRHHFPKNCSVFCSSYETLDLLHNKWTFNQKIKSLGFPVPKSTLIKSYDDLNRLTLSSPYILKPCYSRASQGVLEVTTNRPSSLQIDSHNPLIAQEYLQGEKYCSYSIAHNGKLTTHLAYPTDCVFNKHACINFKIIKHEKIQNWVTTFVQKEHFTGQIAFDFVETHDKKLYCIECNPRGTSGLHLYQKSDNLPQAFLNPNTPLISPQLGYSKQIAAAMLLYGWKHALLHKKWRRFLKVFFTYPDVFFALRDLRPFLFHLPLFCIYTYKSLKLKTGISTMFTFDIAWDGKFSPKDLDYFSHTYNKS